MTGQLGSIVADHYARQTATLGNDAQLANDPPTGQRGIKDTPQALPPAIVDDVEHAKPPAAGQ